MQYFAHRLVETSTQQRNVDTRTTHSDDKGEPPHVNLRIEPAAHSDEFRRLRYLPSLAEALEIVDPQGNHDVVVNVQGDLPTIDPRSIGAAVALLADRAVDIATLCAPIADPAEAENPNVVKLVGHAVGPRRLHALYFTRARAPWGDGPLFHHIGLYAYRRKALTRFVALPPGELETREKLEQLRALEAGMRIDVGLVDTVPLGVDTPADLARVREFLESRR